MKRINAITIALAASLILSGCTGVTGDRTMPIYESDHTAAGWDKKRLDKALFEQQTRQSLYDAFLEGIARPLCMQVLYGRYFTSRMSACHVMPKPDFGCRRETWLVSDNSI